MASKPSPKQCVKIGTAKFPTLANLTVPDVGRNNTIVTPQRKKNLGPQEPNSDLLINLNKLQQQFQKTSRNLEGQIDVMNERINFFESNILRNKEDVTSIKEKISRFTCNSLEKDIKTDENQIKAEAQELSPDTIVDYLQNKPIILNIFLNQSKNNENKLPENNEQNSINNNMTSDLFDEFTKFLSDETKPLFIRYSIQQLNRFSRCFNIFTELIQKTKEISFFDSLTELVKKIYNSNNSLIFIKSSKLGHFSCYFESKEMQIIVSDSKTTISDVIETGECKTYTDPSSSPFYSPSFDPLFNPNNKSLLLIPISNKAVIYILHTDPLSFCFTNEDCAVGSLLSILLEPLLHDHLNHQMITDEMQRRNELAKFENEITKISHFYDLILFLQESIRNRLRVKNTQLFLIDENEIFTYFVNQERMQILKKSYDKRGIIQYISKNKRYITVNKLNKVTVPSYDEEIDSWSKDQPFSAYPIFGTSNEVTSVICISGKDVLNKFNEWDNEFMQSITPVLGLIVQRCIENEKKIEEVQMKVDLTRFPISFSSLKSDIFIQPDFLRLIGMEIEDILHCEWLSIFINTKFELSLHNHQVYQKPIISVSFSSKFFGKKENGKDDQKEFNFTDVSRIPGFEVGDCDEIENPSSFILVTHNNITICAINAKTRVGHFIDIHKTILKAFASVITVARDINELQSSILSSRLAIQSLNLVIDICQKSIKGEIPFKVLITSLCEMAKIDNYSIYKRVKLNRTFRPIISSIEYFDETEISDSDPLIKLAVEKNSNFEIGDKKFDSKIQDPNNESKIVMISTIEKNDCYLFFFGKEKIKDEIFALLSKLTAVIKAFYENYILTSKREILTISNMNKIEVYNSSINKNYLCGLSFISTSLSESQQIEALLLMIKELKIMEVLQTDFYKLSLILYEIRDKYKKVPYHNFSHAVDVSQFVYMSLIKGKLLDSFEPIEIVALFLASICHDISHDGIDSTTMTNCNSALSFSFGILSPLERNHAFIASELLKKTDISQIIDNQHFWEFFVNVIIATDITRSSEFLTKFNNQFIDNGKFDKTNKDHRLLLAQFIVICGNISNCIRPFEFASLMAERINQERSSQIEYENNHDYQRKDESNNRKLQEIEVDFIEKTASSLFKAFNIFIPDIGNIQKILNENTEKWKKYNPP